MHKNGQPNQTHKLKRVSLTSKFGKWVYHFTAIVQNLCHKLVLLL